MTYDDAISLDRYSGEYHVVLNPQITTDLVWTEGSTDVWTATFGSGRASGVILNGVVYSEGSSSTYTWRYFDATGILEVTVPSGLDPNNENVIVSYEIHISTSAGYYHRIPTDTATPEVYFEGVIVRAPVVSSGSNSDFFGFLPSAVGPMTCLNTMALFEPHIHDRGFNNTVIKVYHAVGERPASIKHIISGVVSGIQYSTDNIIFSIRDKSRLLNKEWRNKIIRSSVDAAGVGTVESFWKSSLASTALESGWSGRPIRPIFGFIEGLRLVNLDYNATAPTTANNRVWGGHSAHGTPQAIGVVYTSGSTTTRTFLTPQRFQVGDYVDGILNTTILVTGTGKVGGIPYIDHAALGAPLAPGTQIYRYAFNGIYLVQGGVLTRLTNILYQANHPDRVGFDINQTGYFFEITIGSNIEVFEGAAGTINPANGDYLLVARAYGMSASSNLHLLPKLGGFFFSVDDTTVRSVTDCASLLYGIMRNQLGIPESEIDTDSIAALKGSDPCRVGFAIPENYNEAFPSYKDVITKILQSSMSKIFQNDMGQWSVVQYGLLGTADYAIQAESEISLAIKYLYDDIITRAIVNYGYRQINETTGAEILSYRSLSNSSVYNARLHNISKSELFSTYLFDSTDASTLASRLLDLLGERRAILRIVTENEFFNVNIGDTISVERERLPGYAYTDGTDRIRKFFVLLVAKDVSGKVVIEADDQKGIEDNPGDF